MARTGERGRVAHLRRTHADALDASLPAPTSGDRREARLGRRRHGTFDYLVGVDPTPDKVYLGRVVSWFRDGTIKLEDARRIKRTLARFDRSKPRLDVGMRARSRSLPHRT